MCEQIKHTGSAILAVRLVFDLLERVFDGAKKLLLQGAFDVGEGVEIQYCCVVLVADGHFFYVRSCQLGRRLLLQDGAGGQLLWLKGSHRQWGRG